MGEVRRRVYYPILILLAAAIVTLMYWLPRQPAFLVPAVLMSIIALLQPRGRRIGRKVYMLITAGFIGGIVVSGIAIPLTSAPLLVGLFFSGVMLFIAVFEPFGPPGRRGH